MATAKSSLNPLEANCGAALREYLSQGDASALEKGRELARAALSQCNDIMEAGQLRDALKKSGHFLAEFVASFEKLHRALSESTAALRRLNEISEQEAMRVAHVLHDESGELLAAVHMRLDDLVRNYPSQVDARVQEVRQFLRQIERQLKQLSHDLRPTLLDDFGLPPAIQVLARGIMRKTKLQISVSAPAIRRLPMRTETAIYRFVQEALDNVVRHAGAEHVVIRLWNRRDSVCCSVADDGKGFDPSRISAKGSESGLGLIVAKERLRAVGGSVEILSAPHRGTDIRVSVPTEV